MLENKNKKKLLGVYSVQTGTKKVINEINFNHLICFIG